MSVSLAARLIEKLRLRLLLRDEYESRRLRAYFKDRWNIDVGLYSYGCFDRWRIPPNTVIGRYCSFARTARIIDANHPADALTTHPFLYERKFGLVAEDSMTPRPAVVGDDVWMGANAIATPGCKSIGRGAIIGAGAVVTRDVPAYAIVAGNPARLLRYRFEPEMIEAIETSAWWTLSKQELGKVIADAPETVFQPTPERLAPQALDGSGSASRGSGDDRRISTRAM